ncbi:MAG: alpha-glucan family phosphorylase, partial [Cyanobacteria bacterium]|nr:alpha-glucan family phosphorylase [Cyanobacteriota bacterium]
MKPIKTVEVVPLLPPELECLRSLAYNLRWSWDYEIAGVFQRLDRALWESTNHNPVLMLGSVRQKRLNDAAADEGFIAHLNRINEKHESYMSTGTNWFKSTCKSKGKTTCGTIAYFSAEFGITEAMPIYSGGLGVLAGDHIKAASDLGVNLVGVGIVYQQGYFRQYLNPDGWQQESYPLNDFYNLPIVPIKDDSGAPLLVSVDLPGRKVFIRIWKAQVGRVPLYLLDTNVPQNNKEDENITDALYHGEREFRMKQEIVLGVGGMRALKAMGIEPTVCHMNEGHSAFLALERIRMLMHENQLSFQEAMEVARAGQVFTTHTAVPAGIDKFEPKLIERYWRTYCDEVGLSSREFFSLGKSAGYDGTELFSMANLAIQLSSQINSVSKLHGEVSRQLFSDIWPNVPEHEVPISHITNGIHGQTWTSAEMTELFNRYLGQSWSERLSDADSWKQVEEIPDEELWRIHESRRQELVSFCRTRLRKQLEKKGASQSELGEVSEVLNPNILTIGFARRFATYKRATLLLQDPARLTAILTNTDFPVQLIIAGKAHPEDTPAKELIKQLVRFSRNEDVKRRLVFIEDYDMNIARHMVAGVDVWLNTPRRPYEACGTSGMKVAFNGGLNVSTLDGWWDECYEPDVGWSIGSGETYFDTTYQNIVESNALYNLLEKEVVPLFYKRDKSGRPTAWLSRMKCSMIKLCPFLSVNRMLRDYTLNLYLPSDERYQKFLAVGG